MGKAKKNQPKKIKSVFIGAAIVGLLALAYWYFSLRVPDLPAPPLKDLAANHKVDLGIHVDAERLDDRVYPEIVSSQFGFVNIDGGAHFMDVQPARGQYDFSKSDKIVEFAEEHDMPVQLHHLVWGDDSRLPSWLLQGDFSDEEIREILKDHITTIVKHYKGRVGEYTVVNEAFTEDQNIYGLNDWFADRIGNDPRNLDDYFIWAHQADPEAKLILNDFYNEEKNSVSDAMYDYLKGAKARGVPIDGIGMQLHVDASRPPNKQAVIDNMNRFGDLGIPVYITEFDVNSNSVEGSSDYKKQLEAQITYDMARACIESRACVSFIVFGVSSKNDLIKKITNTNSRDYMFDSRYRPRPSFFSFRRAWSEP